MCRSVEFKVLGWAHLLKDKTQSENVVESFAKGLSQEYIQASIVRLCIRVHALNTGTYFRGESKTDDQQQAIFPKTQLTNSCYPAILTHLPNHNPPDTTTDC